MIALKKIFLYFFFTSTIYSQFERQQFDTDCKMSEIQFIFSQDFFISNCVTYAPFSNISYKIFKITRNPKGESPLVKSIDEAFGSNYSENVFRQIIDGDENPQAFMVNRAYNRISLQRYSINESKTVITPEFTPFFKSVGTPPAGYRYNYIGCYKSKRLCYYYLWTSSSAIVQTFNPDDADPITHDKSFSVLPPNVLQVSISDQSPT